MLIGGALLMASKSDYEYRFTESELQEKLGERLPLTKKYLYVFDVTLDEPRVDLTEGSERIAAGIDVVLNINLGSSTTPLGRLRRYVGGD